MNKTIQKVNVKIANANKPSKVIQEHDTIIRRDTDLTKALETPVLKSETSRDAFADRDMNVPQDLLFLPETTSAINSNISYNSNYDNEEITISFDEPESKIKKEEHINFDSDESKWLYACSNTTADGDIYNFDKDGNLIAKLDVNTIWNRIGVEKGSISLSDMDKEKLLNIISETKKQINFIEEQERLKDEIKGYPEYNEGFAKLYKPELIIPRFKREKNILRTLLAPKEGAGDLRLLLSIAKVKSTDYFSQLIKDEIIASERFPVKGGYAKDVYQCIKNCIAFNNQFPSIKTLINVIGLPYSEEFFDEYLFDELIIDKIIKERYHKLREIYCRAISEQLKDQTCVSEELIKVLNQIDIMTIPPSSDTSFENLKSTLESQEESINLSTGIKILDNNNAYLKKGKISTVFAYTGSFKTMFCSNVAYNIMKNNGNILYLSLEINKEEMYINFLSRHSYEFEHKISHSDVKSNRLSEEDKEYLFNTVYPDFKDNLKPHLIVYDETDITSNTYAVFSKLLSQADNSFIKKTGHGIDLVIVDHLNLLKFDSGERVQNDYSAVNHWMSFFRKNAINFLCQKRQISILCACQSSREGYKSAVKDGKYSLTGIAEGNEIERSSQLVLSIYTTDKDREENKTQMQILKCRDNALSDNLLTIGLQPKYYTFGLEAEQTLSDKSERKEYDREHINDSSIFDD